MAQKKKNFRTRYSKAKPLGMRNSRTAPIRRTVKRSVRAKPAPVQRKAILRTVTPELVHLQAPKARPRLPEPRAYVQRRRAVLQFFRHSFVRSATVFVLLGLFTATLVSRAETDVPTYRAAPTTCTGWNAADNVKTIDASQDADSGAIPAGGAATIQSRTADQPASGDPQLKCKSFTLPEDFPKDVAIRNIQLLVSLAVQGNPESEDVLVLESSFDGQQWNKLDSFFLTEDMSNATHGGYWTYPFAKLAQDAIGTLQVRARFVSTPTDKQVGVRIDGMALEVGVRQQVSNDALKLPSGTVTVEKSTLKASEQPVVSVKVAQPSRFKMLGIGDTKRTVDSVQITAPDGKVSIASYSVSSNRAASGTVEKLAINTDTFTAPGKYITETTIVQDNKQTTVKNEFLWGVLVINMDKSLYWPGETVNFGMGVLDPTGKTICDADLTLTVTAPNGEVSGRTSAARSIVRSATCGPTTITDVADYSAQYDTSDAGTYNVSLTAKTTAGTYTITDAFIVQPVIPIAISRHGSMRIFPLADYTMAVDVRPQQAYKGIVEEYLPPSFQVVKISDNGKIIREQQRTILRWQVNIAGHTVKTLSYRYNPPDISPEIFRLGPLQVGDVQESRQWQIASDAISGSALTTASSATDSNSYTTASITPTANALILAWVSNTHASAANTVTLSGNSLTWVSVNTVTFNGGLSRVTLFRAMGASPTTGTVTITVAGTSNTGAAWSIQQYTGTDTTGTNGSGAIVQSTTNTATAALNLTLTLAAFGATGNGAAAAVVKDTRWASSVELGWTAITGTGYSTGPAQRLDSAWRSTNDTQVVFTDSNDVSADWGGIAVEIKVPVSGVTVSGTVLKTVTTEGDTFIGNPPCDGSTANIRIRVNGGSPTDTSCNATTGAYSTTITTPTAGDVITVYINDQTANATTVTRYNSGNVTGLDLYQDRLILRHEDATALSNTNLDTWDSGNETDGIDGDVGFTVTAGALTVSNTRELHVWTGKTFTPGGAVTTNATSTQSSAGADVHITASATLSMAANDLSVGGDFTNAGTYSYSSTPTVTFTGTTTGFTITPNGNSFPNVTFNGSGGGWSNAAAMTVANNLTVTAGAFSMGNSAFTVSGTSSISGTINTTGGATGTRTFTGDVTVNTGGVWDLSGQNPATSFAGNIAMSGTTFNDGTNASQVFTATKALSGSSNMTFGGTVTINTGITLTNNNTGTVQFATVNGATGTSNLATGANSYTKVTAAPMATGIITPSTSANTFEYAYATATVKVPTTNPYYSLTLSGGGTVTMSASITTISGTLTLSSSSAFTTVVALAINGGLALSGTASLTIANGFDVTLGASAVLSGFAAGTIGTGGTGKLIINNPTVGLTTTGTLNAPVRYDVSGDATYTMYGRTYGGAVEVYNNSATTSTVTMDATAFVFSSTLTVNCASTGSTTVESTTNDPTVTVAGIVWTLGSTGNPRINLGDGMWTSSGNVNTSTCTQLCLYGTVGGYFKMTGAGTTLTVSATVAQLGALEIAPGAGNTVNLSGALFVYGNGAGVGVKITSGIFSVGANAITVRNGDWDNAGTFTTTTNTVTLNSSTGSQTVKGASTTSFYNLTLNNQTGTNPVSSPGVIFTSPATVTNTLSVTSTMVRFTATSTYSVKNLTTTGTDTNKAYFRSSVDSSAWVLSDMTGTQSIAYLDVRDSNDTGTTANAAAVTNVNSGNNTNWTFSTTRIVGIFYDTGGNPVDCAATNYNIQLSVNGGALTNFKCTNADGSYTFPFTSTGSATAVPFLFYLTSSQAKSASEMIIAAGNASITSKADLTENHLVLTTKSSGGTITNADLNNADASTSDAGKLYTTSGTGPTSLTLSSNMTMDFFGGSVYSPGGSVTTSGTGGLLLGAAVTATFDTSGNDIAGDVSAAQIGTLFTVNGNTTFRGNVTCSNACNYTSGTPTITVIGASKNLRWLGSGGSGAMYNLTIGDGSTTTSYSLITNALTLVNDLTITNAATFTTTVNLTVNGGDINTTASGTGSITYTGTPTVSLGATGTIGPTSGGSGSGLLQFYNLTINAPYTTTFRQSMTVDNNLTQLGGASAVLTYGNTPTLTMPCVGAGTCNLGSSSGGAITLYQLTCTGSGTVAMQRSATIEGDIGVGTGTTLTYANTPTVTMHGTHSINGPGTITFYNLTVGDGTVASTQWNSGTNTVAGALTVNAGSTFTQASDLSVAGSVTNVGTGALAYSGTPTLTMSGTDVTLGGSATGTVSLYRLSASGNAVIVGAASGDVTFVSYVNVPAGGFLFLQSNLKVGGGLTSGTTGYFTNSAGGYGSYTSTVTMTGTGSLGGGNAGTCTFYNLTLSGTATVTQQSACQANGSVTVPTSTTYLGQGNNLNVYGGTMSGDGTVTFTGGQVTFRANGNIGGASNWTFYDLYFDITGQTGSKTTTAQGAGQITITHLLTTTNYTAWPACGGQFDQPGTCYHIIDAGSKTWNLTGTGTVFTNSGWLTGNTSTFNYSNATGSTIGYTQNATYNYYHHLTLSNPGASTPTYTGTTLLTDGNMTVDSDVAYVGGSGATYVIGNFTCNAAVEISTSVTTGSGAWTIRGNLDASNCDSFTVTSGNTLNMLGTANTMAFWAAGPTLYNLNIDPITAGTITATTSFNVSNTLTVASGDQFTISSAKTVAQTAAGSTLSLSGTINGPGRLTYKGSAAFPTGGALASGLITRFDAGVNDVIMSPRTDYQYVEADNVSVTAGRNVIMGTAGSQTISIANDLTVQESSTGSVTLTAATNAPAVNVAGNVSCGAANTKNISMGAGTWTVSGNFTLTDCGTVTTTGNTLVMNGATKTLTSASKTLNNLTLTGTITLASATHTMTGNLDMTGGTVTPGTSTVTMTGSGVTITGAGQTLNNLTLGTGSGASITLQTSDLTVSGTVNVGSTDAFTINSGRTLTHTGATLTLAGTLNGPGTYEYQSGTTFPTGGALAAGLILRFNVTGASQTMSARTDYQYVEAENSGATGSRTVTLGTAGSQTLTLANDLTVKSTGAGGVELTGATNGPAVNVGGNFTCTASANSKVITTGAGVWTVSGNVDMTNCTTLTTTAGNTLAMNGASKTLTTNGFSLKKLSFTGGSVTTVDAVTATDDFSIGASGALTQGANVNITLQGSAVSIANGGTFTRASGSGVLILDGASQTFTDSNVTKQNLGTVQIGQSPSVETLASDMTAENVNIHTTDTLNTKGYDITITHHLDCQGTCTLDLTDTAPNNETDGTIIDVGGNWTMSGTLTAYTNSKVFFNSTAATNAHATVTTGGQTFYDVEFKNAGATNDNYVISGNLVIAGTTTLTDGGLILSTNNPNVNTAKSVTIAADAYVTKGTGTWTFDGTTAATYTDSTATPQNLGTVVFNKTSGVGANDKVTLASSMTVDTADIQTGDTLDLGASSYVLKLAKAGATATVLTVTGTLTPGTSTVQFSATNSGGNINVPATTYSSLQFSGAETYDQTGHLTGGNALTGSVTIDSGATLDATTSNYNIAVAKDWSNAGTYTARSGTVYLVTANAATVSGSTTFNNFNISGIGAAKTLTFVHGTTQTVNGTWTATGSAGNILTMQRDNTSAWTINPTAATVDYATVSWSNSGLAICATHSTDGGNNNGNWTFTAAASCGVTISGNIYTNDGSTAYDCAADNLTVAISVNGGGTTTGTCTLNTGAYSVSPVTVAAGNVVTVFLDNETPDATTVTRAADGTSNITLNVYQNRVIVRDEDGTAISNTNLDQYDNGNDADIPFTVTGTALTVHDATKLLVWTGKTFTPGGTVTTSPSATTADADGDVLIQSGATLAMAANALSIGGDLTTTGSLTYSAGQTTTFTATGTGFTVEDGTSNFSNLTFNGAGGGWAMGSAATVSGDLTVTAGTLSGTNDLTLNGSAGGGGTITLTGGTFLQRVAAAKNFGSTSNANDWTFSNLSFENSAGTDQTVTVATGGTGKVVTAGTLTIGNATDTNTTTLDNETNDRIVDANGAVSITSKGILQASSTAAFTVAGNWTNSGDFTDGTGTVTLDGASQQTVDGQLTGASDRFYDLAITNTSGSNPETSPSVIFAASADTADDFIAQTASTKLRFLAGGTYTFQKVTFNGQATGTRVALRSSTTGTSWALNVAGTRTVSNTDVRDSNACGQAPNIDATDGTNFDSTNNNCWDINTLTFAINDVAVGFGTLTSGAARWANGTATGSGSAVAAHTLAVTTNARNGYALSYFGPTLVGPETIDAATFTGDADGTPGSKQFALAITTDGNGTIPSAYQQASNNYSFVPSTTTTLMSETGPTATETASVYYLCNIATTTLPGAYSTNVTYIATSTF